MKTKILFISLIFPVLLTGCIQDCITDPAAGGNTITFIADLPGESASFPENGEDMPGTRVGLVQESLNVKLNWEVGDKIYLVFAEGSTAKGKQTVTLAAGNILNDGKKASFSITIPGTITSETFNLYGVYGVTGFSGETYNLNLQTAPWSAKTLGEVQNKDVMLLRMAATGINRTNPSLSIAFAHVGSLFHIRLVNNSGSPMNGITRAELFSATAIQVEQNTGNATYNPVTGAFSGTTATGTSLPFEIGETSLENNGTLDFWGWYSPVAEQNWPWLGLRLTYDGTNTIGSVNFKEKRESATATGKAYHFYASLIPENGTQYLKFTNSGGNPVVNTFTDSDTNRDPDGYGTAGSYTYKLVLIGDQIWMAENLKYLPAIHFRYNGSDTEARYYVFGYPEYGDPTLSGAMEATTNYTTYGVLYNWPAAMNGETSSWFNPSGVQGICPNGWHLPSMLEWNTLRDHLGGASVAGNKMKETGTTHWTDTNTGATNESGFTALPGGFLDDHDFVDIGDYGYWWSSLESDYYALFLGLSYDGDFGWLSDYKNYGCSVRCVRD